MKINWKLRAMNKTTLIALITMILGLVYSVLGTFGVVTPVSEELAMQWIFIIVDILALLGIVTDPTTKGLTDSEKALNYNEPK